MREGWTSPASAGGISRLYSRLVPVGLAIVALLFASASIDYWTIMRFFGSRGLALPADAWKDPVFSRPLPFYLFDLPFYSQVFGFVFVLAILVRAGLLGHGAGMATVAARRGTEHTSMRVRERCCCRARAAPASCACSP